ncbi:hypothetical protein SAMN04515648_2260 [Phyllobacterium sp. CL33Tsu]|nr:hypothetical protein SAMN04515648_2260 [Phyllobacterium sp. CL33Tsu]
MFLNWIADVSPAIVFTNCQASIRNADGISGGCGIDGDNLLVLRGPYRRQDKIHAESRELIAGFERKVADLQHSLDSERERVGRFSDANRRLSGDADALREKLGSVVQKLQNKDRTIQ